MNGVRRLLGTPAAQPSAASSQAVEGPPSLPPITTSTPFYAQSSFSGGAKPSWPPSPLFSPGLLNGDVPSDSSPNSASPERVRSSLDDPRHQSFSQSRKLSLSSPLTEDVPTTGSASIYSPSLVGPFSPPPSQQLKHTTHTPSASSPPRRSVQSVRMNPGRSSSIKDDLLITLLASEAMVAAKDAVILSSEELEQLKKEHQILSTKADSLNQKLRVETKIRDAAESLSRVNSGSLPKRTSEQLDVATKKVEITQKELWSISQKVNDIHRKILEHRSAVLSRSLRTLEHKISSGSTTSGYSTSFRSSSGSDFSARSMSAIGKFEGPHFFAGHSQAVQPISPSTAAAAEVATLKIQLKDATEKVQESERLVAEFKREASHLRLEKIEVETSLGMELQAAEEMISKMEVELHRLEDQDNRVHALLQEREEWRRAEETIEEQRRQIEALELDLDRAEQKGSGLDADSDELHFQISKKEEEIRSILSQADSERQKWTQQVEALESDRHSALARLKEEHETIAATKEEAYRQADAQLRAGVASLRSLMQSRDVAHTSMDMSISGFVASLERHLDRMLLELQEFKLAKEDLLARRSKLEDDLRSSMDKRENLSKDVEESRRAGEQLRGEIRLLQDRLKSNTSDVISLGSTDSISSSSDYDSKRILSALYPLWNSLPSPEARAAKLAQRRASPSISPSSPKAPSLSDLDVRSLKSLYDPAMSSAGLDASTTFSVEAFASRVQALIVDDRALIERLVRFAQAHDLLKKNAERAQKLAQESSSALETYQKQVKALEERNMMFASDQASLQDEIQRLQDIVHQLATEKREVEIQAEEQANQCRQLEEANNILSTKTLALAEEAAAAPVAARKQLEGELKACKATLEKAEQEINDMRSSESLQRVALLDELNSAQTENNKLRAQLRAASIL